MDRANIDDTTPSTLIHAWQRRLRQQERRREQNLHQLPPLRLGKFVDRRDKLYPRIVDEDIQTPRGGERLCHQASRGSWIREIGGDKARPWELPRLRLTALGIDVGERHRCASLSKGAGRRQTNTTCRARDQRDPSFERRHVSAFRCRSIYWCDDASRNAKK